MDKVEDQITIDVNYVKKQIKEKKHYFNELNGSSIRIFENSKDEKHWLFKAEGKGQSFSGNVDQELKRSGFGAQWFEGEGNFYAGNWQNDMKQGAGLTQMNGKSLEMYYGNFDSEKKEGLGLYMWDDQEKNQKNFFQGWFENDSYITGVYMTSGTLGNSLYLGEFKDKKRNDKRGILWSDGVCFIGEFKDDKTDNGTIVSVSNTNEPEIIGKLKDQEKVEDCALIASLTHEDKAKYQEAIEICKKISSKDYNISESIVIDFFNSYATLAENLSNCKSENGEDFLKFIEALQEIKYELSPLWDKFNSRFTSI